MLSVSNFIILKKDFLSKVFVCSTCPKVNISNGTSFSFLRRGWLRKKLQLSAEIIVSTSEIIVQPVMVTSEFILNTQDFIATLLILVS